MLIFIVEARFAANLLACIGSPSFWQHTCLPPNPQEEYVLSQGPAMNLLARAAKSHGVRAVGEDVYAYLSLATEQHLNSLLRGIVKARLQREDLGK